MIAEEQMEIAPVNEQTMRAAFPYFKPDKASTHHTLFDAVVAATAKTYNADAIFSFDRWYKSLGLCWLRSW